MSDKLLTADEIDEFINATNHNEMKSPKLSPSQLAALNQFSTTEYVVPTEVKWDMIQRLTSLGLLAEQSVLNGPNKYRRRTQKELIEMLQKY